jgi:hypothetical protein
MIPALTPVQSSNIAATGHDGENLFVRFHSGPDVWRYAGVSKAIYSEMLGSGSVGKYFQGFIRKNHKGEKVAA